MPQVQFSFITKPQYSSVYYWEVPDVGLMKKAFTQHLGQQKTLEKRARLPKQFPHVRDEHQFLAIILFRMEK